MELPELTELAIRMHRQSRYGIDATLIVCKIDCTFSSAKFLHRGSPE